MTGVAATGHNSFRALMLSLLQAGLSYLRWTQTVPMVLAWAFALLAMLAALFVGFQEQGFAMLVELTDSFPGLSERLRLAVQDSGAATESDGINLTGELLIPWVLRAWGILAALLMVIDWLRQRWQHKERHPTSLRRKLGVAMAVSLVVVGIMVVASIAAGADVGESVLPVLLIWVILSGVSAYSLTFSHLIDKIQQALDKEPSASAISTN